MQDNTGIKNVTGMATVRSSWSDSYSVGNACYCESTFDHSVGDIQVVTPLSSTTMTVRQVCDLLGPGPGSTNRPKYNDVQCGNGPPYASTPVKVSDEISCPGRVEYGIEGCKYVGPKWNFQPFMPTPPRPTAPAPRAVAIPTPTYAAVTEPTTQVLYFNWWNADNNTMIGKMRNNERFCKPNYTLGIEAIANNNLQAIKILVSGALTSSIVEGKAPYYAFGNKGTDIYGKEFVVGNYTIKAYPNNTTIQGGLTVKIQVSKC